MHRDVEAERHGAFATVRTPDGQRARAAVIAAGHCELETNVSARLHGSTAGCAGASAANLNGEVVERDPWLDDERR